MLQHCLEQMSGNIPQAEKQIMIVFCWTDTTIFYLFAVKIKRTLICLSISLCSVYTWGIHIIGNVGGVHKLMNQV